MKLLLAEEGIDVDSKDNCGRTPMWWAVGREREAVMKLLLAAKGVELDLKDNFGQTPLSLATSDGCYDTAKLLFEKYQLNGGVIRDEDAATATPPAADHLGHIYCDICMLNVPDVNIHHHCGTCGNGDFGIHQGCIANQEFCLDRPHNLVKGTFTNGTYKEISG